MTDATNFRRERIEKLLHELRYEAALVMWAANSAVYELSYPEARADSLRQVAEEIDCGGGCDKHCGPHTFDRGDFCGFAAAEDLRKLANALDLKAKVDAEGLAAQTPPDRRALTMIAAECHRAKWQFDIDDEEPPKAAAARVLVDLAFKTLHRIGDMALNLRNGSVVPSTHHSAPAPHAEVRERLDREWNAAIAAAEKAVTAAPIFPKKNHGGPIADGERLMILEACREKVSALSRPVLSPTEKSAEGQS